MEVAQCQKPKNINEKVENRHAQTSKATNTVLSSIPPVLPLERQHAGFRVYKRLLNVWSCSKSLVCTAGNKFQVSIKSFTFNSFSLK